jgi:hypothetical protein
MGFCLWIPDELAQPTVYIQQHRPHRVPLPWTTWTPAHARFPLSAFAGQQSAQISAGHEARAAPNGSTASALSHEGRTIKSLRSKLKQYLEREQLLNTTFSRRVPLRRRSLVLCSPPDRPPPARDFGRASCRAVILGWSGGCNSRGCGRAHSFPDYVAPRRSVSSSFTSRNG